MEPDHTTVTGRREGSAPRARRAIPTRQVLPLAPWMSDALLGDVLSAVLGAVGAAVGGVVLLKVAPVVPDCVAVGVAVGLMAALILFLRCLYFACIRTAALLHRRCVRATGPIGAYMEEHLSEETNTPSYSHHLWADGKRFTLSIDDYGRVGDVSWGTIEYAPVGRRIFTVRDAAGRLVLAHPTYSG